MKDNNINKATVCTGVACEAGKRKLGLGPQGSRKWGVLAVVCCNTRNNEIKKILLDQI